MDSLALDSGADMPAIRPACPEMMAAIGYGQARDYRNPIIRFLAAHHDMWPARLSKRLNWKKLILGLGFLQTIRYLASLPLYIFRMIDLS